MFTDHFLLREICLARLRRVARITRELYLNYNHPRIRAIHGESGSFTALAARRLMEWFRMLSCCLQIPDSMVSPGREAPKVLERFFW